MAVTVQVPFTSAVTAMSQDACVGSAMENGTTMLQCDLRQHALHYALGTQAQICWRQASSPIDVPALSTCPNPMTSRCIVAPGVYRHAHGQRIYCTPTIQGVATSQPRSHSVVRLACSLAGVCGVRRRPIARRVSALFLMPRTKASITRGLDDMGAHLPTPEEMLRHLLALTPVTECPMDGDDPLGTDHGVMVVKDAHARILMPHEAASEHGDDARQCLQRGKDRGLQVTAAVSDASQRFTEAINAVSRPARGQADQFHTVKHSWGHLKPSRRSSRRTIKAQGEAHHDEQVMERAKTLGKVRWRLLKKPATLSLEAKQALAALASEDAGCVQSVRPIIRQLVHSFDHTPSAAPARIRWPHLRQDIHALEDRNREKMLPFFDDHGEQALRYLRKKGMGTHRRGSNSASGRRLRRRLAKNHDGIRSATTRQHDRQIYQAMQSRSLDIADFLEQGPQMAELPCV